MKYSVKSILFLGIGGVSMHQLAIALKNKNVKVCGYDAKRSKYTKFCEENGIKVYYKFKKDICNVDLCVKTGAIKESKFLDYLKTKNVPIIDRSELLGWVCGKFKHVIAVAGTHGKSTTASLIYEILRKANKKVSCHIGAEVENARFNFRDNYLVVEACEYNKSFLHLKPTISVVTNIEKEHMDCYKTMFNLRSAFLTFLKRGDNRFVFVDKSTKFLKKYNNINFVEKTNLEIQPKLKGEYNLKNISLAIEVCKSLGIREKTIISVINEFEGIKRRYEYLGKFNNSEIFIDYAHHPTELKAFIETFNKEKIKTQIIFQPHTFSRTKMFLKEFISVLSKVENLIIFKEYSARENVNSGISAKDLYMTLKKVSSNVQYCETEKELIKGLSKNCAIAFVGAGDINLIAERIVK